MQPIPDDILKQFNAVLELKAVPSSSREDYRKWLHYYFDFRVTYPQQDKKSEQVRLFMKFNDDSPRPQAYRGRLRSKGE